MFTRNKVLAIFAIVLCFNVNLDNVAFSKPLAVLEPLMVPQPVQAESKYPDYAFEYVGSDKFENFNRRIFAFNLKLNRYAIRPVHILWASVMPKYGINRIQSVTTNIEYPKRLVSCLIQKDFKGSKTETVRFLTNTTIGLGGLYDPASSIFKLKSTNETMEQALCKCRVKPGPYIVIPVLSATSPRDIAGRILDASLNPSSYVATPVLALVKAGLLVNRTSYMQPMVKMVESTYADPYDIAKKYYGIENYIKNYDLDRTNLLETSGEVIETVDANDGSELVAEAEKDATEQNPPADAEKALNSLNSATLTEKENSPNKTISDNNIKSDIASCNDVVRDKARKENVILSDNNQNQRLFADMLLFDYKPQNPVVDAMRTALFELPDVNNSIWSEISIWNRCFAKQIKTACVNVDPTRDNYQYRYIMQKDKNAPVAIIYPSIGEGIQSHHSVILAKLFYDEGYSVIIQGSHFQWEFVKSMPKDYRPGIPSRDADYLKTVTSKIVTSLQSKYKCEFRGKVVIGTSFGAMTALFLADKEAKNNTLNITKYISINPPIELIYAMKQIDKNTDEWNKNPGDLKNRVAVTAAKVVQIAQLKDDLVGKKIESLPFTEDEAKLITGFIMHQKLSDLIFTIENTSKICKTDLYKSINNMDYQDYAEKYLLNGEYKMFDDLSYDTSLHSIAEYLRNNDNYKIYHTLDDYLVNQHQLSQLKQYSKTKTVLVSNGSHLGYMYRPEFLESLKKDITLNEKTAVTNYPAKGVQVAQSKALVLEDGTVCSRKKSVDERMHSRKRG